MFGLVAVFVVEQVCRLPDARHDVHQVQDVDGVLILGPVFESSGRETALAVAERNQRLRGAAQRDMIAERLDDGRLAEPVVRRRSHTSVRPETVSAGRAAVCLVRAVVLAEQRGHEFFRSPHVPIDRGHTSDAGHLLLVLLLFLRGMSGGPPSQNLHARHEQYMARGTALFATLTRPSPVL